MQKLHVGCGKDYRKGFVNLDISPDVGADVVCDILNGFPFPKDTFSVVLCNNVLTQILCPKDFVYIMNELWTVTDASGSIYIRVPNAKDICAWQDPMDCRRFTDQTFTYMEHGHNRYEQYGKHYGLKPFEVTLLTDNGRQMEFKLVPIK